MRLLMGEPNVLLLAARQVAPNSGAALASRTTAL